jgi:hypothetical protein
MVLPLPRGKPGAGRGQVVPGAEPHKRSPARYRRVSIAPKSRSAVEPVVVRVLVHSLCVESETPHLHVSGMEHKHLEDTIHVRIGPELHVAACPAGD